MVDGAAVGDEEYYASFFVAGDLAEGFKCGG